MSTPSLEIRQLSESERDNLQQLVRNGWNTTYGKVLEESLEYLLDAEAENRWSGSHEHNLWNNFTVSIWASPNEISQFLTTLACADSYVANGIARRALQVDAAWGYNGDLAQLARGLTSEDCDSARMLEVEPKARLCELAEWAAEEKNQTICSP